MGEAHWRCCHYCTRHCYAEFSFRLPICTATFKETHWRRCHQCKRYNFCTATFNETRWRCFCQCKRYCRAEFFFQTASLHGHLHKKRVGGSATTAQDIAMLSFFSGRKFVRPPSNETHWRCFGQCEMLSFFPLPNSKSSFFLYVLRLFHTDNVDGFLNFEG